MDRQLSTGVRLDLDPFHLGMGGAHHKDVLVVVLVGGLSVVETARDHDPLVDDAMLALARGGMKFKGALDPVQAAQDWAAPKWLKDKNIELFVPKREGHSLSCGSCITS